MPQAPHSGVKLEAVPTKDVLTKSLLSDYIKPVNHFNVIAPVDIKLKMISQKIISNWALISMCDEPNEINAFQKVILLDSFWSMIPMGCTIIRATIVLLITEL